MSWRCCCGFNGFNGNGPGVRLSTVAAAFNFDTIISKFPIGFHPSKWGGSIAIGGPPSSLVYFRENPNLKWMTGGYPWLPPMESPSHLPSSKSWRPIVPSSWKDPKVCPTILPSMFSTKSCDLQDLLPPAAMDTDAPLESWNKSEQAERDMDDEDFSRRLIGELSVYCS